MMWPAIPDLSDEGRLNTFTIATSRETREGLPLLTVDTEVKETYGQMKGVHPWLETKIFEITILLETAKRTHFHQLNISYWSL
jgi:hypothetical protein